RSVVVTEHPDARSGERAAGPSRVFRVAAPDGSTWIVRGYPVASRERRERRAVEALAGVEGVPRILGNGLDGDQAWLHMTDAGSWNLASLPRNDDALEAAGRVLKGLPTADASITNLHVSIDADYV